MVFILSSGRFCRISTVSSGSSSFTASASSSLEIFETNSCCISSPRSAKTSPSSLVSKSEKNNFLCLGGEDSRAWAISDDDNFFNRLLISSCESSEELSNN